MTALTAMISRFSAYLTIGVMNTLVCLLIMYLGHRLGLNYMTYTALGYLLTITFSFFMNLRFTFQVEGMLMKRLGLFMGISLVNLCLVEGIEYGLIDGLGYSQPVAVACGMIWYMITGFLASNFLVYRVVEVRS